MPTTVKAELERHLQPLLAHASMAGLLVLVGDLARRAPETLSASEAVRCQDAVKLALRVYCKDAAAAASAVQRLGAVLQPAAPVPRAPAAAPGAAPLGAWATRTPPAIRLLPPTSELPVRDFDDAMKARVTAKEMAQRLGFSESLSVRIATAVSELARNIVFYAGAGSLRLEPAGPPQLARVQLKIVAADHGPGIANLEEIFSGNYKSQRGLGMGLIAVKRLMDEFQIDTAPGRGTVVTTLKRL